MTGRHNPLSLSCSIAGDTVGNCPGPVELDLTVTGYYVPVEMIPDERLRFGHSSHGYSLTVNSESAYRGRGDSDKHWHASYTDWPPRQWQP